MTTPVTFVYVPGPDAETSTLNVHVPPGAIVASDSVMRVSFPAVSGTLKVTVPPPQPETEVTGLPAVGENANKSPPLTVGSGSATVTPVIATALPLPIVIVKVE